MLRTPELKPFIVYVRPPPFDVLKETRHQVDISVVKYSTTIIISHMHLHYNHNNDHNRRMLGQPLMRQILAPLPTMSFGI